MGQTKEERFFSYIFEVMELRNEQARLLADVKKLYKRVEKIDRDAQKIVDKAERVSPYEWSVHEAISEHDAMTVETDTFTDAVMDEYPLTTVNNPEATLNKIVRYMEKSEREAGLESL